MQYLIPKKGSTVTTFLFSFFLQASGEQVLRHAVWVGSWRWAMKEAVLLVPSFSDFCTGHQKGQGTEWVLPGHLPVGQWIEESNSGRSFNNSY